jgi:hypothetical protein
MRLWDRSWVDVRPCSRYRQTGSRAFSAERVAARGGWLRCNGRAGGQIRSHLGGISPLLATCRLLPSVVTARRSRSLRLVPYDPQATAPHALVRDGADPVVHLASAVEPLLLEAIAGDEPSQPAAAGQAGQHAISSSELDRVLFAAFAPPGAGTAWPPSRAPPCRRGPPRRGSGPARRAERATVTAGRTGVASRAAHPQRDPRAAISAHPHVRAADRRRAVGVGEHCQDAPVAPIPEARRVQPPRGLQ